jgi:DNA-binding XRE family transcriptional regulator
MPTERETPFFELDEVRRLARKWSIDCGVNVAAKRNERGWTRVQLASLVGTTEATIHRVEAGAVTPRDYLKMAIAAALATPVEQLWPYPDMAKVFAEAAA